jgi:hypothetical protein
MTKATKMPGRWARIIHVSTKFPTDCISSDEPWRAMAQEYKATATCTVLGQLSTFRSNHPSFNVSLKASSRHRPILIGPEGLTARDHRFAVNNRGLGRLSLS